MKFIDYNVYTGEDNMRIDSEILDESIALSIKEPTFRLYGWKPACVSLGRNQSDNFLDKVLLDNLGIDIVRRLTGGRALLHDIELTYSYVTPKSIINNGENISDSYKYISGILIEIFKRLDINLTIGGLEKHISHDNYCMSISTGADLCINNKKFIGSAQCRKNGYILQHGSILIDYNKPLIEKIFHENTNFDSIITLNQISKEITIKDITDAAKETFNNLF